MFTSRAEYRLSLRADNADARLTPLGERLGIVSADRVQRFAERERALDEARALTKSLTLTPNEAARAGISLNQDGVRRSAYDLLAYPELDIARLRQVWPELGSVSGPCAEALETEARYAVYLERQARDADQLRREEERVIPENADFSAVAGLSNELRQKLAARRPRSIAEAQRVDGMTPAALALVISHVRGLDRPVRKGAA